MVDLDRTLSALEYEVVMSRMRWSPALATSLGRHEWDGELGSRSATAIAERCAEIKSQIRRLNTIALGRLEEPYQSRLTIHLKKLRFELSEEVDFGASKHDPGAPLATIGQALNGLVIRDFAPLPRRVVSLMRRLAEVPRYLEEAKDNFRSCSPIHVQTAMQQATGIETLIKNELPPIAAAVDSPVVQTAFGDTHAKALEAVRNYIFWLRTRVLPDAEDGIAWGRDRMQRLVQWQECVEAEIDPLIRRGEADLREHQRRLREVATRINPDADPAEVVQQVAADHPTAAELLPFTEQTLEQLRQFCIDHELVDMPTEVRIQLRETPGFSRATTLAACSPPGRYETVATEAYYYVTPPDPGWDAERADQYLMFFSRWALPLITAHEAYPGHYVHLARLRQIEDSVPFTTSTTTTEGWAHYIEQLMIESGWGDGDPRFELMQIREALLRLCRYLAAFGMHVQGWSYEDAVNFFMREGHATRPVAELESRRGAVHPSYFAYTLGKHEILDLREKLKQKWGEEFSLKRFHNAFIQEPYPTAVIAAKLLAN